MRLPEGTQGTSWGPRGARGECPGVVRMPSFLWDAFFPENRSACFFEFSRIAIRSIPLWISRVPRGVLFGYLGAPQGAFGALLAPLWVLLGPPLGSFRLLVAAQAPLLRYSPYLVISRPLLRFGDVGGPLGSHGAPLAPSG